MSFKPNLLLEPFPKEDVLIRPGNKYSGRAMVLAYIDARAVMDRLDSVMGVENWKDEYEVISLPITERDKVVNKGVVICNLSLRINDEWITKSDVAEPTTFESVKGGFSDALKRAAVKYGVGRYLYSFPTVWAELNDSGKRFKNESAAHAELFEKVEYARGLAREAFFDTVNKIYGIDKEKAISILNKGGFLTYQEYEEGDMFAYLENHVE